MNRTEKKNRSKSYKKTEKKTDIKKKGLLVVNRQMYLLGEKTGRQKKKKKKKRKKEEKEEFTCVFAQVKIVMRNL